MLVNYNAVFLVDEFMETNDRYEGGHGQTSCVGCDCIANRIQMRKKNLRLMKLNQILNLLLRLLLLQMLFLQLLTMSIHPYNQHMRKKSMLTLLIPCTKPSGKIAYCQHAASLIANKNKPTIIEEALSENDENEWCKASNKQQISGAKSMKM